MNIYQFYILISIFLFGACNPIYYAPNAQNVPIITEKEDFVTSVIVGGISGSGKGGQTNIQGAYGLTKEIAIQANYFHYSYNNNESPPNTNSFPVADRGKASYFEMGGGYFYSKINQLNFEIYGLLGIGKLNNQYPINNANGIYTNGSLDARIVRYGIQPIIAHKSKHFGIAVSTRFVILNYSKIDGDLIFKDVDQIEYLSNRKMQYLIEPAITILAGWKYFKLRAQFGTSSNKSYPDFAQKSEIINFGLILDLNIRKVREQNETEREFSN